MKSTSILSQLVLLAPGALVLASPALHPLRSEAGSLECLLVKAVVDALEGIATATPFCSSFLHIPTVISTATTTTSIPTTTVTTTSSGTATVTADTVTITKCGPPGLKQDRAVATPEAVAIDIPDVLTRFASAQISTACSCLSIPTPTSTYTSIQTSVPVITQVTTVPSTTVTVTPTTIVTMTASVCPIPAPCSNQGVQWAEYPNEQGFNDGQNYRKFESSVYETQTPSNTGATSDIGGFKPGDVYGLGPDKIPTEYFVLSHRGYFYAPVAGTYVLSVTLADDIALAWVGAPPHTGWARATADLVVVAPYTGRMTFTAVQGEYVPLHIMYAEAQGPLGLGIEITGPNDKVLVQSGTDSPYLVQFSCDGTTAPPPPALP